MAPILSELRDAIRASAKTRYRLAKETGISEGQLSRLMSGQGGLSIDALERLAAALGLDVTVRKQQKRKTR
jgi:transcriptional regulator with XRE-family HTH domain